jgi:hypothetical protein
LHVDQDLGHSKLEEKLCPLKIMPFESWRVSKQVCVLFTTKPLLFLQVYIGKRLQQKQAGSRKYS